MSNLVPYTTSSYSKVVNNAGSQFGVIKASNLKVDTLNSQQAVMQSLSAKNIATIPLGATGTNAATVYGYTSTTFGTLAAGASQFLNTSPTQAAASLSTSSGVLTLPSGANIVSTTLSNIGSGLTGSLCSLSLGYQNTASGAAAGTLGAGGAATGALMGVVVAPYSVFVANTVASMGGVSAAIGGVPAASAGRLVTLSAEQSVIITNAGTGAFTSGGPMVAAISYFL